MKPNPYIGPLPDKVLLIKLANRGKLAAYEVEGWLTLDAACLEPLDYFVYTDAEISQYDGQWHLETGGQSCWRLLPGR